MLNLQLYSSHNMSNHGYEFLIGNEDPRRFLRVFSLCMADEA